jgi:hypothetical protein
MPAADRPPLLTPDDVHVDQEARKAQTRWDALQSFHRAPCLRPSIGMGALGGLGIGMIRFLGGAGGKAAFTWGSVVGGLLAGSSWFTCRRTMYARMPGDDDSALIGRLQTGDKAALLEYQAKLQERERRATAAAGGSQHDANAWVKKD